MTVGEMKDIHNAQQMDEVEMIEGNKGKLFLGKPFMIPAHEAHLVFVSIEQKRFDAESGNRLSKPFIQSFYKQDYDKMSRSVVEKNENKPFDFPENAFSGKEVIVLHYPESNVTKTAKNKARQTEKPLEEMSIDELRIKFKEVHEEDADPADNATMLIAMIKEKISA